MKKALRYCLLGSNSGRNAGDLALLETFVDQVSERCPGSWFEIPTTRPAFIAEYFRGRNVRPVNVLPWTGSVRLAGFPVLASMRRSDISVVLDGIIFDHRLLNPAFNFLITLVPLAPWARFLGRPMVLFEVGVGPLKTSLGRRCARLVANTSELIMVRERDSERMLREAGVTKPLELCADAAFICRRAPEPRIDDLVRNLEAGGRPLLGVNVTRYGGEWVGQGAVTPGEFQRRAAVFVDGLAEATGALVVLTGTQHMDRDYLAAVRDFCHRKADVRLVTNVELTPPEIVGLMARMDLFVGSRLHSLILASSVKTPVIGLTYAPKVRSLFTLMERPELALDLSALASGEALPQVLGMWQRRALEKERLSPLVDTLRGRAAAGFDRLVERYC